MRMARVWTVLLGVERTVVESVEVEDGDAGSVLVVTVRPSRRAGGRCPYCRRRCRGYDQGEGVRRWRGLDLGSTRVFLQAKAPRVRCREHGVVVAAVPWARHGSWFTTGFEDQVAWLVAHTPKTTVEVLMRTSWRAITGIVTRVVAEQAAGVDRLDGLRRIGIDEKSYRKGHKYLTVVVDHDTGRVVWAADRRDQATVGAFFDALGPDRTAALTHVSCDGAEWIHSVITTRAPGAVICLDSFHVVAWATTAVDEVRRRTVRDLRGAGDSEDAAQVKGTRWAVLKNPENLTTDQRTTVAALARANGHLYKSYLMKEQLRELFKVKGARGRSLLIGLIAWASRSRIPEMIKLAKTLTRFRDLIINTLTHGVTNALAEATNTHLNGLIRRAYGFHTPAALIALIDLTRGGLCPPLPGRS